MKKQRLCYKKLFQDKKWLTISNVLTISRIILTPFIVLGIAHERWFAVFYIFIFVGVTDLLDGYLARLLNQETYLGKVLDPIADKFLIVSTFSALAFLRTPSFSIPYWFVLLVVLREITIMVGTFILLNIRNSVEIAPSIWGKLTTLFQLLFIFWIFVCYFFGWAPSKTYYVLLSLLALFSLMSLFKYVKLGIQNFKKS